MSIFKAYTWLLPRKNKPADGNSNLLELKSQNIELQQKKAASGMKLLRRPY
jgi:hypothetical protein